MSLSKMHVRFIQSQKEFGFNQHKSPICNLYIKDQQTLYFFNTHSPLETDTLTLAFNEATPALNSLTLNVSVQRLTKGSEEYDDALLFFNASTQPTELLLLRLLDQPQST